MQIIISLSNTDTELMPVATPELTPQALEAEQRKNAQRTEREYAEEGLTQKEIDKKEQEKKELEEQQRKDDPNRLPETMPKDIGLSKIGEDETATTITNRHDNLPGSAA